MSKALEDRLQDLIGANSEANRKKWPLEARKQGKKVIGVGCSYIPGEVITAAGMLPFRLTGTWTPEISPVVAAHRPNSTDPFYNHLLDARVKGQMDFLDGVVFANLDDDMKRLYDVWTYAFNTPFDHIVFLPHHARNNAQDKFKSEIQALVAKLEKFSGKKITNQALADAVKEYNKMRGLLMKLYDLRKKDQPALTGAEALGITTAAQVMPVAEFNRELEALLPYLKERAASVKPKAKRVMVVSDALDNPAFLKLIEDAGTSVVMDDLDTGSRWFWKDVDAARAAKDPVGAIAFRYLTRPACPRMGNWDEQIADAITWAKDFRVEGVIDFTQLYNYPRQFLVPSFREAMTRAKLPTLCLTRDYVLTSSSQISNRIQAFIEMLSGV